MKIQSATRIGTMVARKYSKWELDSKKGEIVTQCISSAFKNNITLHYETAEAYTKLAYTV